MGMFDVHSVRAAMRASNEKKENAKNKQRLKDGFGWAMTAYYIEEKSLGFIEMISSPLPEFGLPNLQFDRGVAMAMDIIAVSLIKHGEYNGPNA